MRCALCESSVFEALAGALLWANAEPVCARCIVRLVADERDRRILEGESDIEPSGLLGEWQSEALT